METGETDTVGNDDFLQALFGDDTAETRSILVSFSGNPARVPTTFWFGSPLARSTVGVTDLPADRNNYFSLAPFIPDEAGRYRRKKSRFHALHAVMLDDVGNKLPWNE